MIQIGAIERPTLRLIGQRVVIGLDRDVDPAGQEDGARRDRILFRLELERYRVDAAKRVHLDEQFEPFACAARIAAGTVRPQQCPTKDAEQCKRQNQYGTQQSFPRHHWLSAMAEMRPLRLARAPRIRILETIRKACIAKLYITRLARMNNRVRTPRPLLT